ncbi:MAG: hypothetical protein IJ088_01985 [Clostridia bacterium]|nr:hypothetical protein [Clostridia bacterium]
MKRFLTVFLFLMLLTLVAFAESDVRTYNEAVATFPTIWNPLREKTATDMALEGYLSTSLYEFDFNEDQDGYVLKPLAAADFPEDVTEQYVGSEWGIEAGETGRAWRIPLRSDLRWEDGTEIHAADFVYSAEKLLSPEAQNYRAGGYYNSNLVITNAEAYLKQGLVEQVSFNDVMELEKIGDMQTFLDRFSDEKGYINWGASYGDTYDFTTRSWTGEAEDKVVETPLTVPELYTFFTEGAGAEYCTWADAAQKLEWAGEELSISYIRSPDAVSFDKVGFLETGKDELTLVLAKKLTGFDLKYRVSGLYLVNRDLYEKTSTVKDGVFTTTYGTSAETTMSWGPYRLATFQSDKVYELVRNENWFGYSDEAYEGQYETDRIVTRYVQEPSTQLEMFLNGELDDVGLNRDTIEEYATSEYTYYSEGDSVFAMVFNPDMEALRHAQSTAGANINKTILTVKEFRMAMSLGMNRKDFCAAAIPMNQPAFALYGGQIVGDPESGTFYRNMDEAKQVVVNFWGLNDEIGEGKLYATVDDAIDAITGYDPELARQYFDKAYDIAIETGLMKESDIVQITVGTPNATSVFYNNGYDFIVNNYTEAVKGTKLEGKLTFIRDATLGNGFADALKTNRVDMLFGVGWTGSSFDPFGLIEVYVTPTYQYDPAWDSTKAMLTVELNGEKYTTDIFTWYRSMNGDAVTVTKEDGTEATIDIRDSQQDRIHVLAACENAILQNYDFIPLMGDTSANLKSMKVEYYVEDEVFPLGRGGLKYLTYNYDDAQWEACVREQGGTLFYK